MFITQNDFDLIPFNLIGLPDDGTFNDFVAEQEEGHMRLLLGNLLYDALVLGVATLPAKYDPSEEYAIADEVTFGSKIWVSIVNANMGNEPVEGAYWTVVVNASRTRWLVMIDGANYTYEDKAYKWFGMVRMVKPLIYALWLEFSTSNANSSGKSQPAIENANLVNSAPDICRGWNKFVDYASGRPWPKNWAWDGISRADSDEMMDSLYGYLFSVSTLFADIDLDGDTLEDYLPVYFNIPKRNNVFGI